MIEGRLMTGSDNRFILTFPDGAAREFTLDRKQAILGRSSACDIVLHDARVSRTHARLARDEQGWTITDLGSTNGLIVNGIAVTQARLSEQDIVQMGDSRLRYAPGAAEPAPATRLIETVQDLTLTLSHAVMPIEVNEADAPRLAVYTHDRTWELPVTQDYVHIGRDATNDITIPAPNVSRTHARIERRGDACLVRDLDSTNGTWLQGRRIDEHLLHNGDTLRIGDAQVVFKAGPEDMTLVEEIAPRAAGQRRPVVFVPGIMGSNCGWEGASGPTCSSFSATRTCCACPASTNLSRGVVPTGDRAQPDRTGAVRSADRIPAGSLGLHPGRRPARVPLRLAAAARRERCGWPSHRQWQVNRRSR